MKIAEIKSSKKMDNKAASNILSQISKDIKGYFNSVLSDDALLSRVAKQSCNHLNGFSKIVLVDNKEDNFKIRLHVWTQADKKNSIQEQEGDLHDHRWSYVSLPLCGKMKEDRYVEKPVSKTTSEKDIRFRYKCYPRGDSEWVNVESYKKVILKKTKGLQRTKGEFYHCKAGEIHNIKPVEYPSATLVLTYNTVRNFARVYKNDSNMDEVTRIHLPSLEKEELVKTFSLVLENI